MEQIPKKWMVEPDGSTARLKSKDDLGLGAKDFLRERNGASEKSKVPPGEVSLKIA